MKRITKLQKQIADAHLKAHNTKTFDSLVINNVEELKVALIDGKTIKELMDQIVTRNVSITSQLMRNQFDYTSDAYKKDVYCGFKKLLTQLNIN